jgi:fatty-acyl-CoA synthase
MIRTVAEALVAAAAGTSGFSFVADAGERFVSFAELLQAARRVGGALRARGLGPGDRVAILLAEPEAFLTTFLGVSAAGLVPTPLPHSPDGAHVAPDVVASFITAAGARALVTAGSREHGGPAMPTLRFACAREDLDGPLLQTLERPAGDAPAIVQFTSGSTSRPKGVVLTQANLDANIRAIGGRSGLAFGPGERGVSWLPLFHDMGLIGHALCPLYHGVDGVFLPAAAFLKRPKAWLDAISRHRGTISFAPAFAYELCVRRVKPADVAGLDLSSWRVAGVGAEPIPPGVLRDFARKFAPAGFRETSFVPAYGLAEHTLAVTLGAGGRGLAVDSVRTGDLVERRRAEPCAPSDPEASHLVSCGPPFPGHAVRIVGEDGATLGERAVGEILVRGPSVMRGYLDRLDGRRDGWLATGDLGYMAGGDLHVCGRRKEMIIVNGRNHFPQDLEQAVIRVPGVRPGRVAAFGITAPGRPDRVVVVVEPTGMVAAPALVADLRRRLLEASGLLVDEILLAARGTIARTTSGKVQRARLRERYEAGGLPIACPTPS